MRRSICIQSPKVLSEDGNFELRATLHCGLRSYHQYIRVKASGMSVDRVDNTGDVWGVLFAHKMMEFGGKFHLKGAISASLLRGLDRYTKAWSCLLPDIYQPIEIEADEVLDDSKWEQKEAALACFSGGLDACFTAYRHKNLLAGAQNLPLKACLLVHGADIRKDYKDDWEGARNSAEIQVKDLGIENFYTVETNFRDMHCAYLMSYYSMLAACMRVFGREYGHLMLGSDGQFSYFTYPSGNNPVTNHFLSSRACELVTDGSEFTRTEKAALVAQWPVGMKHLRVCYSGDDLSTNCGTCPKCRRTRLNFMAVGVTNLPCMPPAKDEDDLLNIRLEQVERKEMTLLLRYLDAHPLHPTPEWELRLRERMGEAPPRLKEKLGLVERLFRLRKICNAHIKLRKARFQIKKWWKVTYSQNSKPLDEVLHDMRMLINSGNAFPVRELVLHYFQFRLQYKGARIKDYIFPAEWFRYFNPLTQWAKDDCAVLKDKVRCSDFLAAHGIAVPYRFGKLIVNGGKLYVEDNKDRLHPLSELLRKQGQLFVKPLAGQQGKGCMLLENINEHTCKANNEVTSITQLYEGLKGDYVVEEVVQQHADIAAVHPQSLNTMRIVTMRDVEGNCHYVSGFHRFGIGSSRVDNAHSGGIAVGIDIEKSSWRKIAYADDPSIPPSTFHPDSGIEFGGRTIPFLKESIEMALLAHSCFERIQSVGWDVAVTPDGPVIIEGNNDYWYTGNQYIDKPIRYEFETFMIPCAMALKSKSNFVIASPRA